MTGTLLGLVPLTAAGAQYPVVPTPVRDSAPEPLAFSGYVAARNTVRNDSSWFTVNRARATVEARPAPRFLVRIQADLSAIGRVSNDTAVGAFHLTDAFVQFAPDTNTVDGSRGRAFRPALLVGQFKTPFTLEFLTSYAVLRTPNRSRVVDLITPRRDVGVFGQIWWHHRVLLMLAGVNGSGPNALRDTDGRPLGMARLTVLPHRHVGLAGKIARERATRWWGVDGRWTNGRVALDAELIERRREMTDGGVRTARGGYALAAVKLRSWIEPVIKWERFHPETGPAGRWRTYGINLATRAEEVRLLASWTDAPSSLAGGLGDELIVQVTARF